MFGKQLIVALACFALVLAGCTSMQPKTPEEAYKIAESRQTYNPKYSFAYNVAHLAGIDEKDHYVTWKDRERLVFTMEDSGDVLTAYGAAAGIAYNPWVHATHLPVFWAPLGLIFALTIGNFEIEWKALHQKPQIIAYVPYTGQTADQARQEVFQNFQKAVEQVLKEKGATDIVKYGVEENHIKDFPSEHAGYYFVTAKDCPAPVDEKGNRLQKDGQNLYSCYVSAVIGTGPENSVQIDIPTWIDQKGGKAWLITSSFINTEGNGQHPTFDRTSFLAEVAFRLPNNYFIYVPKSVTAGKWSP
ncbi:MAG: hypothetical protein LUC43_07940, partial [Burkholderiales bacterium]|nr:hypothetical protein [Burkholderiales bacterium]